MRCVFFSVLDFESNTAESNTAQPNIWVKSFWLLWQAPATVLSSAATHLCITCTRSCRAFWIRCWWRMWHGWSRPLLPHPRCIIEGDRVCCGAFQPFPLYRCAPPPLQARRHMCPLWNGNPAPLKKRQPGADHDRTYANVDTAKYHTRRGGKKSLRGKQIG